MSLAEKTKKCKVLRDIEHSKVKELLAAGLAAKSDDSKRTIFELACDDLDQIRVEFMKHHSALINLIYNDDDEVELATKEMHKFNSVVSQIRALFTDLFSSTSANISSRSSRTSIGNPNIVNHEHINLPKIELIKFNGDIKSFPAFYDLFENLVHKNPVLSSIEKFSYLISHLEGTPLGLVKCLPMSAANYSIAYENLVKRYKNSRLLAQAYWSSIENAPSVSSDDPQALRNLLDTFSKNLEALKTLNLDPEAWDFVLTHLLLKKVDTNIVTRFEIAHGKHGEIPLYRTVYNFLENHCDALFTISPNQQKNKVFLKPPKCQPRLNNNTNRMFTGNATDNLLHCKECNSDHALYNCPRFTCKTPQERFEFAKNKKLCCNCLSNIHRTPNCRSVMSCRICKKRHHTLLHLNTSLQNSTPTFSLEDNCVNAPNVNLQGTTSLNSHASFSSLSNSSQILLATAIIEIQDVNGNFQRFRTLLDSGSQISFVTQKCANILGLPRQKIDSDIQGIGDIHVQSQVDSVFLTIRPVNKNDPNINFVAMILPKICAPLPSQEFNVDNWSYIKHLKLADPNFNKPGTIDCLIGADLYPYIIQGGRIFDNENKPVGFNSIFGIILLGKINNISTHQSVHSFLCKINCQNINNTLTKFWEIENIPSKPRLTPSEEFCENLFVNTYSRNKDGRYIVTLPFSEESPKFLNSRDLALNRFLSLERRLLKNPSLYSKYSIFLKEYLDLGHMEHLKSPINTSCCFYIPHHPVERPDSLSTPVRVVFNASAKNSLGKSLNDVLLPGPKLQADVCQILINFRLNEIALTCDISKMYRQILVSSNQCDYQRILWRFDSSEPVSEYRLRTLTYGTSSAPFLALRVLKQLAIDEEHNFPNAAKILLSDVFVDDIVTSCPTIHDALIIQKELTLLLKKGGFQLHKWASNSKIILEQVPESIINPSALSLDYDNTAKILGLCWHPQFDYFTFHIEPIQRDCTKRNILSELARVYDPLGLLSPCIIFLKCLIQTLWVLGIDWDSTPPPEICVVWERFRNELSSLKTFTLPRHINLFCGHASIELHGFADASEKAYAAVVYMRVYWNSRFSVYFIASKTRVAPLKTLSIPRLELCAATLLSDLIEFVARSIHFKVDLNQIYAWSDSTVALSWIKSCPSRWKSFVANRVALIQEKLPPENWFYIETSLNPADVASRGIFPKELLKHNLFYQGPEFLTFPEEFWPKSYKKVPLHFSSLEVNSEEKKIALVSTNEPESILDILLKKYSSFSTLNRVLAYILRFKNNCRNSPAKKLENISSQELYDALIVLIKHVQNQKFATEILSVKDGKNVSKHLKKLNVFLDSQEVLRVGGRLYHSTLSFDRKFPILLPRDSILTILLINDLHKRYLHAGVDTVQHLLCQKFWIISAKHVIRSVLSKCVQCFKVKPRFNQPLMGNLPSPRISQLKPFSHSGVDYGGPFSITMNKHRGAKTTKAYVCLFVCLATKAIHLELASDLTTDAFIAALRRFVARRGRCSDLYSDNGTNFVGANQQLLNFDSTHPIKWHFIPPSSPNFGGLWESNIKSTKTHLARVVGSQILTYEEFYTILCQIEAIINSRPLTPLSTDPNDLSALTPGHFLTLEPLNAAPDENLTKLKIGRLSRWQLIQRIQQDFWKRWQREYLHTLQQRSKWFDKNTTPDIGSLVIIRDDLLPPLQWQLGRIAELYKGSDNIARVALVKTSNKLLKRPISKLCLLPIDSQ